eukprot:m.151552 g.151552  ORF g.151552 m.151552 type:complete len:55 (-) comp24512_c0_seq5:1391-1555(-)
MRTERAVEIVENSGRNCQKRFSLLSIFFSLLFSLLPLFSLLSSHGRCYKCTEQP